MCVKFYGEKVIIVAELLRLRMKQRDNKVCKSASGSFNL